MNETKCIEKVRPLDEMYTTLQAGKAFSYNFISPNQIDDIHDTGNITDADAFLQQIIPKIQASDAYKKSGLIIITADEGSFTPGLSISDECLAKGLTGSRSADGPLMFLALGPNVVKGKNSSKPYTHYSMLRTIQNEFGLDPLANSATAPAMTEMFTTGAASSVKQAVSALLVVLLVSVVVA